MNTRTEDICEPVGTSIDRAVTRQVVVARADRSLADERDLIDEEGGDLSDSILRFPVQQQE